MWNSRILDSKEMRAPSCVGGTTARRTWCSSAKHAASGDASHRTSSDGAMTDVGRCGAGVGREGDCGGKCGDEVAAATAAPENECEKCDADGGSDALGGDTDAFAVKCTSARSKNAVDADVDAEADADADEIEAGRGSGGGW